MLSGIAHGPSQKRNTQDQSRWRGVSLGDTKETYVLPSCVRIADDIRCRVRSGTTNCATRDNHGSTARQSVAAALRLCQTSAGRQSHTPGAPGRVAARSSRIGIHFEIRHSRPHRRRCSEPEPANSLRDKWNVIGSWLASLTFFVRRFSCPRNRNALEKDSGK